jgi:hypothetical protein
VVVHYFVHLVLETLEVAEDGGNPAYNRKKGCVEEKFPAMKQIPIIVMLHRIIKVSEESDSSILFSTSQATVCNLYPYIHPAHRCALITVPPDVCYAISA